MLYQLRQYQAELIVQISDIITSGKRRIIVVAPTGSGKTLIGAAIIKAEIPYRKILFIAHRDELLTQAKHKLIGFDINAGIIKAGRDRELRPLAFVQIAGIQTLHARAFRAKTVELPEADIVFIDEAHHVRAKTYQDIVEAYPNAIIIGLTATPCRGDGRGLGNVFEALIECPQIHELIALGYLVKPKIFAPPSPNLKGISTTGGDYQLDQLADRMNTDPLVGDIVEHWLKYAKGRRTIAFAVDIAHSVHIRNELIKSGVRAEHVDGSTPAADRQAIVARLASGETEVVVNVGIFNEGFDSPEVGAIVLARPTKSLGLFRQMIGRGLRPAEGKTDVIILDHSGGVHRHGRPDDPIEWCLSIDKKAANKAHEARIAKTPKHQDPFLACPQCQEIRMRGFGCDACGWKPEPKGRAVEFIDGELIELGKSANGVKPDKLGFYRELMGYQVTARRRDGTPYSNGWAAQQYKQKYGVFPPWDWNKEPPIPPSPATARWIKSRQIAFAKARAA